MEDREQYLNEDDGIIIEDSMGEHWRDVDEDDEDNSNTHALRWDV